MSETDAAIIGVESCGCVTWALVLRRELTRKDEKEIGAYYKRGGSVERTTVADARQRPHFLVTECPHDPKGWHREEATA